MNSHSLIGFTLLLLLITGVNAKEIDPDSGLIIDDNLKEVKTNCTVCHSAQNIIRQSGTRLTWLGLIRWMQNTQGLWELEADTEDKILDYLETHYGQKEESYRRASISPFLMPPNPYKTQATLSFVSLEADYQSGDTLNVDLTVQFQESYSKGRLDLWVAVHLPNTATSEIQFMSGTPSAPLFKLEPQVFQRSLEAVNKRYNILKDFPLPSTLHLGEYRFYALLVEAGTNPLESVDIGRSLLGIAVTTLHH